MADVKSKLSAAVSGDFASSSGTPIVCNQTSGEIAVMKADNSVFIIGSDKAGISQVHYVGTTSITADRASAPQALTGITSIDGNSATSTTATTVSTTVASGAVGTTQTALDNSTKIATTAYADNAGRPILATVQATTSGTTKDFTGIPSWVKRITVMINGVSLSATSIPMVQLGSTTFTTSGYAGASWIGTGAALNFSTGFVICSSAAAAELHYTVMVLTLIDTNKWMASISGGKSTSYLTLGGGSVTIGGTLDRVRLTSVNGTDTFDAGSVNIMYE